MTHVSKSEHPNDADKPHFLGFAVIDRYVLQIIATALKQKLVEIDAVQERLRMQQEVVQTIKVAGSICN